MIFYNGLMEDRAGYYKEHHQKHVCLVDEILSGAYKLLHNDGTAKRLTYNQAKHAERKTTSPKTMGLGSIAVRSVVRAVDCLHDMLNRHKVGAIVPDGSEHSILVKKHHKPNHHLAVGLTELRTTRSGLSRMMTLGIGDGSLHRVRAVVLSYDERYTSLSEIHPADDYGFDSKSQALIDGGVVSLHSAFKNGKELNGRPHSRIFEFIQNSLVLNNSGLDVDAFVENMKDRYYFLHDRNGSSRGRKNSNSEMTYEELQSMRDFIVGDQDALELN